jgi:hypothetical protein
MNDRSSFNNGVGSKNVVQDMVRNALGLDSKVILEFLSPFEELQILLENVLPSNYNGVPILRVQRVPRP